MCPPSATRRQLGDQGEDLAAAVLQSLGMGLNNMRLEVEKLVQLGPATVVSGQSQQLSATGIDQFGTALTVQQIRLIKRFTKNIVLLLDADALGSKLRSKTYRRS